MKDNCNNKLFRCQQEALRREAGKREEGGKEAEGVQRTWDSITRVSFRAGKPWKISPKLLATSTASKANLRRCKTQNARPKNIPVTRVLATFSHSLLHSYLTIMLQALVTMCPRHKQLVTSHLNNKNKNASFSGNFQCLPTLCTYCQTLSTSGPSLTYIPRNYH